MTKDNPEDALLTLQGMDADWAVRPVADLARRTNDLVREIADREMEPGLSPSDFTKLLIEAARRAEADADPRA